MPKVFVSCVFFKGTHGGKRIFQGTCESLVRREGRLEGCGNTGVSAFQNLILRQLTEPEDRCF